MVDRNQQDHISTDDLSAYADGELDQLSEVERIRQHLDECERCRSELEQLKSISILLSELPEPELPRSFRLSPSDVQSANEPEPIQPWLLRYQSSFRAAGMAAVLLLALVLTIDVWTDRTTDDDDVAPQIMTDEPVEEDAPDEPAVNEDDAPGIMGVDDEPVEDRDLPADEEPAVEPEEAPEQEPAVEPEAAIDDEEAVADDTDAAVEPDDAPDPEIAQEPADEERQDQVRDIAAVDEEGMSLLQIAAIALAGVAAVLLTIGFVIPRWWSSSASHK